MATDLSHADLNGEAVELTSPIKKVQISEFDGQAVPMMPRCIEEIGIERDVLLNLALKAAYTAPTFTTQWAAKTLCLALPVVSDLLEQLRSERLIETLGQAGPLGYRFGITQQGRERAKWLMTISGYVGAAPVSVAAYSEALVYQVERLPLPTASGVSRGLADLVLPELTVQVAGQAVCSGRSLFLFGPPGNGKTSIGRLLQRALSGTLWIPKCIGVENSIIKVFDPQCHISAMDDLQEEIASNFDRRWVRIQRPFVTVGGELTLDDLDLIHIDARGYYEAPLHMKANGGIFLLDDFGCQRTAPIDLMNRWIVPLELQVDYLTLKTGQQIEAPFRHMLIVSTNQDPERILSPALLRRMGYRLQIGRPSEDRYTRIFSSYAARLGLAAPPGLIVWLIERYRKEGRPLNSCEPRDLIERVCDLCKYQRRPPELNQETLDLAWQGYFGTESPEE